MVGVWKIMLGAALLMFAASAQALSLFDEAQAERLRLTTQEWQALDRKTAVTRSFEIGPDGQQGPRIRFLFPELEKPTEIVTASVCDSADPAAMKVRASGTGCYSC